MTATKRQRKESAKHEDNPLWQLMNTPRLAARLMQRDRQLVAQMRSLADLPSAELGKLGRCAMQHTSAHRIGKSIQVLFETCENPAIADILRAVFEQCEFAPIKK